ncbi:hypothetical protein PRIPAC_81233 [Pristionchus pacificus]|uniref:Uncharacterized protein n=1 Tax=Pristionchus pacificus TaxID=54126 RepID=A0A2A6BVT0_PRIPA|nr:hypothetical protein PRIPAC_81233 [Pristionchus pacificus]|eukprot:PDM69936.1 hypothetical protein PRIPAC_49148 [Pristionchus pacificus]
MTALEYEKDGIRMWRPWEVGVGKKVPYKNLIPNDARLFVEKSGGALSDDAFWVKMGDPHYIEKEEKEDGHLSFLSIHLNSLLLFYSA